MCLYSGEGVFQCTLEVPEDGCYQYKFLVDGQWMYDSTMVSATCLCTAPPVSHTAVPPLPSLAHRRGHVWWFEQCNGHFYTDGCVGLLTVCVRVCVCVMHSHTSLMYVYQLRVSCLLIMYAHIFFVYFSHIV